MNANKKFIIIATSAAIVLIMIFTVLYFISKYNIIEKPSNNLTSGKLPKQDTILTIDKRQVFIKICEHKPKGTFILLHGWNLPADDWCSKTTLCKKIIKRGYNIVMPDMGKSVYQEINFHETRSEWLMYPTRKWLSDTLIPLLQKKYSLLLINENN